MGWWKFGDNDMLGDLPADGMTAALEEIVADVDCAKIAKPTLEELVSGLILVLRGHEPQYLEDAHPPLHGFIKLGSVRFVDIGDAAMHARPQIVERLRDALEGIANAYVDAAQRRPRLSEILATLTFTLSVEPDRYVCDRTGQPLRAGDLVLEAE